MTEADEKQFVALRDGAPPSCASDILFLIRIINEARAERDAAMAALREIALLPATEIARAEQIAMTALNWHVVPDDTATTERG